MTVLMKSASAPAAAATTVAAPKKTRRRGRGPGRRGAKAKAAAAPKAVAKKGRRTMKKATGLSKRSVSFLQEFSRNSGGTLTADRLAKVSGAKGPKGVGGSLTALGRELKSFGYSIDNIIGRKKTLDGTVWTVMTGAERLVSEILGKVPQTA